MDLKLTITREYFDMILSGIKKEEYREIKPYWTRRFEKLKKKHFQDEIYKPIIKNIHFFNGAYFGKDIPNFKITLEGFKKGVGRSEWGAIPNKTYYVLELGEVHSIAAGETRNRYIELNKKEIVCMYYIPPVIVM